MSFNTAITGLLAASTDLNVTGNNIANASTVGFKQSRAEFADVYAHSMAGGSNHIGTGVRVSDVAQQFSQGTVSFTKGELDLAINGNGFFVLSDKGSQSFTRAGQFKADKDGYVVTNDGARLQGFLANEDGAIPDVLTDIQLKKSDLAPVSTTKVDMLFNVNADDLAPAKIVNNTSSNLAAASANQGNSNDFAAGTIDINGKTYSIPASSNQSAALIATALNSIDGVKAKAKTEATLTIPAGFVAAGELSINGNAVEGVDLTALAAAIDALSGFSASETGGIISITESLGSDISFIAGGTLNASVVGGDGAASVDIDGTAVIPNNQATVGGQISLTLDADINLSAQTATSTGTNLFPVAPSLISERLNGFDADDTDTYNNVRSTQIYDSLGTAHELTQYFVKEPSEVSGPNTWTMHIKIDGKDVGPANPLTPDTATQASYTLSFFDDGSLDVANSDQLLISNWTPLDEEGSVAGALGPLSIADGARVPVTKPAVSSNFMIEITGSTQYSGKFSVNESKQDGYSSGTLTSYTVADNGDVSARYSNDQSLVLGRVAMANFTNQQGLRPIGDTSWVESVDSGQPLFNSPNTASLGSISSGALEDSNVDLSEELVALIIAQRNFQANSRTIETNSELQQTIINLR